ncbi:MAG: phytoene/squalene synthase family protein [Gammaproteobacteria bacterium]|nr:phytoene/squalene synthase family protein [Gammaproteobacteria bacterium]MCI0591381.1 phytoene/squalene synthase family protein [Gammaproteobacteria bacterium]
MTTGPSAQDEAFQAQILQGVSRTFALTIPQLPPELSRVVSNAYLLCRIADTIEDDNALASRGKRQWSDRFIDVVAGNVSADVFARELQPLLSEKALDAESDLVKHTPRVIRITHSFNPNQRRAIERCIRIMAEGMARYQEHETLDGLKDLPDMDRYCYYVAGVVGEMLTELFCDYSDEINENREQLMPLAVSFGQGLQMTNILKDIWEDRIRGACWLPRDVFHRFGFDLTKLAPGENDSRFVKGLGALIGVARAHLRNALTYTLVIPRHERGIRRFCLWALGMAVLTLQKINRHRNFKAGQEVKISRRSVKGTIVLTNLTARSDKLLKLLFYITSKGLPVGAIHEKLHQIPNNARIQA